jgi:hypothetical protein
MKPNHPYAPPLKGGETQISNTSLSLLKWRCKPALRSFSVVVRGLDLKISF